MGRTKKVKSDKEEIKLNDPVIRKNFIIRNLDFFQKENTVTVNEFGISKKKIADIFYFDFNNNTSYIFEIKGENDNPSARLSGQVQLYTSYANVVYVVITENHIAEVEEILSKKVYGKNIGIIVVDKDLNFVEKKKAVFVKCNFDTFIKNLDKEELDILCKDKGIEKIYGSKNKIISYIKRRVSYEEIIISLRNKLEKYYIKTCPECGGGIYFNKYFNNIKKSVCLICGEIFE